MSPAHAPGTSPKDWPEDFKHENGNYMCRCGECGAMFFGHKRRPICKECADATRSTQSETARR